MANYSIIINSKFKPFSYAEMLAPVLQSTEAHQLVEEAYANLSVLADAIAAKANELTDPKAYARYKMYSELLRDYADRLAKYGLLPNSRREMFEMRSRYAKDIIPIEEAALKRTKYADIQFQALLLNPTLLIGKKAATTSLDEFIDNPNIDFSQLYSGATLMLQVATLAQSLAKELTSYGSGRPLDSYTNTFLKKFGFTREEVLRAINNPNDVNSSKVLTAIVDLALVSSGIPQWGDEQTLARARAYANQGLWAAIGQSDVSPYENFGARTQLLYDLLDRNNARQSARAEAAEIRKEQRAYQRELAKQALSQLALADKISTGAVSYLEESGDLSKYKKALDGLVTENGGIKARYFGKNGRVNPLFIYEKYLEALKGIKVKSEPDPKRATSYYGGGAGAYVNENKQRRETINSIKEKIKKEYNVKDIISSEQYEALKAIGLDKVEGGKSSTLVSLISKASQLYDALDKLGKEKSYYSTKLPNYNYADELFRNNAGNLEANNSFKNVVHKLTKDGKEDSKNVSYKDLNLYDEIDNKKGRKLSGVYYSLEHPNKIIVQIGKDRYLVDPNLFGAEYANLVDRTTLIITANPNIDKTLAATSTTVGLVNLLNSYNQLAPTTEKE